MGKKNLLFILALASVFSFQSSDVPVLKSSPKTCCGRPVCLCKHAKGAFCPMGHAKKAQGAQSRKSCHLPAVKKAAPESKGPVFAKAPCAEDAPKTVLPGISRDFEITAASFFLNLQSHLLMPSAGQPALSLFAGGLERPPKLSISF